MKIEMDPSDIAAFQGSAPLVVLYTPRLEDGCSGDESYWPTVVGIAGSTADALSLVERHHAAELIDLDVGESDEAWTCESNRCAVYVCEGGIMRYCIRAPELAA